MGSVHIGIGHDNDFMITQFVDVEFTADPRAQRHDQGIELIVAVNFVSPCLFHIEHLTPHGQNRLESGVPPLNGRAGG